MIEEKSSFWSDKSFIVSNIFCISNSLDIKFVSNITYLIIKVSIESWKSWESWEIEQAVWESHGIFFSFEKSWEIHGIFLSCILENSIWVLLNTLLEVFVAESIKLTLRTYCLVGLYKF